MVRSRYNSKNPHKKFNKSMPPRKAKIKAALREQVWLRNAGPVFTSKCQTRWCNNDINVFNFQCGHIQAESKGGPTTVENLIPLCSRCNQSMGTTHLDQWNALGGPKQPGRLSRMWGRFKALFRKKQES
jgi:5-methylcytosine-specific restriction endonuclease McrA